MRWPMLLAVWWLPSLASAQIATLAGTYAAQGHGGPIVVTVKVSGEQLIGRLEAPGSSPIVLLGRVTGGRARGTISSVSGSGAFEAAVDGDTLKLTLSQKEGPGQRAVTLPLELQRVDASVAGPPASPRPAGPERGAAPQQGGGDARLVGIWVSQDLITSGSASMASEQFLVFQADGSYAYGRGRAVAGGSSWSYEGGGGGVTERGRWRTDDGILYMSGQTGQWNRIGRYGMTDDGQTMRIIYTAGGRKLWSRSR